MRVLVAPQEFKGTLTAAQAAEAIAGGLRSARPEWSVTTLPIADGGPGTLEALIASSQVEAREVEVEDPLGRTVHARFGMSSLRHAFVEMAEASGLWRLSHEERDALSASTRGTGELIRAALDQGAVAIDVGAGGSATSDGGKGALEALGVSFLDAGGTALEPGGGSLEKLARIDMSSVDPRLHGVALRIWVDVQNPLTGPEGAARIYAPQKGAMASQVEQLERGLVRLASLGRSDAATLPGSGAAGGLAFGLVAFAGARIVPGFDALAELIGLDQRLRDCDLVITGEGRVDVQTSFGKGPASLARRARALGLKAVCFAGQVADAPEPLGFDQLVPTSPSGLVPSPAEAAPQLEAAARAWAERAG